MGYVNRAILRSLKKKLRKQERRVRAETAAYDYLKGKIDKREAQEFQEHMNSEWGNKAEEAMEGR